MLQAPSNPFLPSEKMIKLKKKNCQFSSRQRKCAAFYWIKTYSWQLWTYLFQLYVQVLQLFFGREISLFSLEDINLQFWIIVILNKYQLNILSKNQFCSYTLKHMLELLNKTKLTKGVIIKWYITYSIKSRLSIFKFLLDFWKLLSMFHCLGTLHFIKLALLLKRFYFFTSLYKT